GVDGRTPCSPKSAVRVGSAVLLPGRFHARTDFGLIQRRSCADTGLQQPHSSRRPRLPMHYFPDPYTGWTFLAALAVALGFASYADERSSRVPKAITLSTLAAGFLVSCFRGGWLGAH